MKEVIALSAMKDLLITLIEDGKFDEKDLQSMGYDEKDIEAFKGYPND